MQVKRKHFGLNVRNLQYCGGGGVEIFSENIHNQS
jgi:hypothetical protein